MKVWQPAIQEDGVLTYLHGDHLGSAALTTTASGARVSLMRYTPYGGLRVGGLPTDRQCTGQRREASLGFYDYVARQYDPALGRFLQADTIVPDPANPQSLNRYATTLNHPLRYTDPRGHFEGRGLWHLDFFVIRIKIVVLAYCGWPKYCGDACTLV